MSKYIIDIPESVKKIVYFHVGNANAIWTTSNILDDLEELNSDYINEHFGDLQDEAYKRGFEDGKKVIHKGCEGCRYSGTPQGDSPCFSCSNYYSNNWQKQDDNIEVGDEVVSDYGKAVVVNLQEDMCYYIYGTGSFGGKEKEKVTKTGRHFGIESILKEMSV